MSNTWKIILIILAMLIVLAIVRTVVVGSIAKSALKNPNLSSYTGSGPDQSMWSCNRDGFMYDEKGNKTNIRC